MVWPTEFDEKLGEVSKRFRKKNYEQTSTHVRTAVGLSEYVTFST